MNARSTLLFSCGLLAAMAISACGGGDSADPAPELTPTGPSPGAAPAPAPAPVPPAILPPAPTPTPSPTPTPPPDPGTPPVTGVPTLARTVVLSGLTNPWDMAFTPDGAMFFTEKCRGLSVRRGDGSVRRLFGEPGSALVAGDFFCRGQSGMLGVAVGPQFAANRFVYVFMQSNLSSPATNRVVRMRADAAYTSVSDRTDIITDLAFKAAVNAHGAVGMQSGGRIRFGPDGYLYVATGDNHSGSLPQDLARLGGKVVRVDRDGVAAPGNNVPGGDPRIFTLGHRNVQGLAFRPGSGRPYACDHGPRHTDEVTALTAGGNGGWDPRNRAALECADGYCGYDGDPQSMPMTDTTRFPNAMRPLWTNGGRSQGTGPCTFLSGPQWGEWNGRLAVGVMAGRRISILQLDPTGTRLVGESAASLPSMRYRAVVQAPDGNLYVMTDGTDGEIWRLTPQ